MISNFRRVMNVVCFLLGDSPVSEIHTIRKVFSSDNIDNISLGYSVKSLTVMKLLDIITLGTGEQTVVEYSKSLCNEICTVTLHAAIHLSRLLHMRIRYLQTIVSVTGSHLRILFTVMALPY